MENPKDTPIIIHPELMKYFIESAWQFLHATLYNNFPFDEERTDISKIHLGFHLMMGMDEFSTSKLPESLVIICQSCVLMREHLLRFEQQCLPNPSIWLDPENASGICLCIEAYKQNIGAARLATPLSELDETTTLISKLYEFIPFRPVRFNTDKING